MLKISHTISPFLIRYLEKLEAVRKDILLHPLSPENELSLRYNATVTRIFYALMLSGEQATQDEIRKVLENQIAYEQKKKKNDNSLHTKIINYKKAMDYLKQEWLVSNAPIDVQTLITLHNFLGKGKLKVSTQEVQDILDYLQVSSDSPFVQAGIAKLVFNSIEPFSEENESFSTLCSYLFIYKNGLDFRGLLILEESWMMEQNVYIGQYKTALSKPNITGWLEYFIKAISLQTERVYQEMIQGPFVPLSPESEKNLELNDRQKAILNLLDTPNAIITNRTVQKIFKISQITASRDLAKLTNLGLIFPHGKGRSVRYTRI